MSSTSTTTVVDRALCARARSSGALFPAPESARDLYRLQFKWAGRFWKGRVALFAILRALGIGTGDTVLVPGYTCVVVPSAVRFVGAKPVYVDIGEQSYNIDRVTTEEAYERAVASGGRLPRALIIQHTYGIPTDVDALLAFARERNMYVIEDCCHAIGSRVLVTDPETGQRDWHYTGTLGDAAFFSSQWSKPVVSGLGGWAVARDPRIQSELWRIEGHLGDPSFWSTIKLGTQVMAYWLVVRPSFYWAAIESYRFLSSKGLVISSSDIDEWRGGMPADYKKTMSLVQAKLILRGLDDVDEYIKHRRELRRLYDESLAAEGLEQLAHDDQADPVLLRYPVRIPDKTDVINEARKHRIELGDWFNHPLHPLGWDLSEMEWVPGQCPRSEQAAADVINLPMHSRIGEKEVHKIVAFLAKTLRGHGATASTNGLQVPTSVRTG